jgi:hypothetical protein
MMSQPTDVVRPPAQTCIVRWELVLRWRPRLRAVERRFERPVRRVSSLDLILPGMGRRPHTVPKPRSASRRAALGGDNQVPQLERCVFDRHLARPMPRRRCFSGSWATKRPALAAAARRAYARL